MNQEDKLSMLRSELLSFTNQVFDENQERFNESQKSCYKVNSFILQIRGLVDKVKIENDMIKVMNKFKEFKEYIEEELSVRKIKEHERSIQMEKQKLKSNQFFKEFSK